MSGVYVATPAADTTPDVPPGWDPGWTFPGPFPPGYEPDLSLAMTATPAMVPESPVADASLTLKDQTSYVTTEPPETIEYSATRDSDGSVVNLKFSGGDGYYASISGAYSDVGDDFWGSAPEFEFEISEADVGDTVILLAASNPLGQSSVTATANILVVAELPWTAVLTQVFIVGGPLENYHTKIHVAADDGASVAEVGNATLYYYNGSWQAYPKTEAGSITVTNPDVLPNKSTIIISEFIEDTYRITASNLVSAPDATSVALVLTMTRNEEDTVYTKTQEWPYNGVGGPATEEDWLTIDGATGEITVINP